MKVLILLAVVVVVRGTVIPVAVGESGASAQFRSEDNLGNYNFGYNEDHTSGGTFRREAGDAHGNVAGSYGLRDADGRIRIVNYIANDDGFKADIKTNEPGVEPKDTADATFNKAESVILQSAVAAPAPAIAIPAPAPVVAIPAEEPIAYRTEQVAIAAPAPVFPPVAAVPVAKSLAAPITKSTTTITTSEAKPITYAFPAPAAAVAKTHTTVTETKPITYAFPAPAAVPVAKTIAAPAPLPYAFPAPAAIPVAKSSAIITTAETKPIAYAFPAPAAVPVAKSIAAPAPLTYAFPAPAAVPVAKSSALTYAAAPIATAPLAYAAPTSKFSYSSQVINAPTPLAIAPSTIAVAPRYALNPYISSAPFYRPLYSPAVASFAGPLPYFSNIEYHGYPVVKK